MLLLHLAAATWTPWSGEQPRTPPRVPSVGLDLHAAAPFLASASAPASAVADPPPAVSLHILPNNEEEGLLAASVDGSARRPTPGLRFAFRMLQAETPRAEGFFGSTYLEANFTLAAGATLDRARFAEGLATYLHLAAPDQIELSPAEAAGEQGQAAARPAFRRRRAGKQGYPGATSSGKRSAAGKDQDRTKWLRSSSMRSRARAASSNSSALACSNISFSSATICFSTSFWLKTSPR